MKPLAKKLLFVVVICLIAIVIGLILWLALGLYGTFVYIIWAVIGTLIVGLIILLSTMGIATKEKASDRLIWIFLLALILIIFLPLILQAIDFVLGAIGNGLAWIRDLIDGGGQNVLIALVPVAAFLLILVLTKYFIDIAWDKAVWITLLTLFLLFVIYCLVPELYQYIGFGL